MSGSFFPGVRRVRRRILIRRLVVLGVLLLVLVGAVLLWPRPQASPLSVATFSDQPSTSGVLQGPLTATRHGDRACFTVTRQGVRSVLRFPSGWGADRDLSLLDPSGAVLAQPGTTVLLLGAPSGVGRVAGCPEEGRVWSIAQVRTPPRS